MARGISPVGMSMRDGLRGAAALVVVHPDRVVEHRAKDSGADLEGLRGAAGLGVMDPERAHLGQCAEVEPPDPVARLTVDRPALPGHRGT